MAETVVGSPFAGVGQDLVGGRDVLEVLGGVRVVRVGVGVQFLGAAPKRALDFIQCRVPRDAENVVWVSHRFPSILALTPPRKAFNVRLLGESVADKTWPPGLGLWPSDHASVAARLRY